MPKCDIHNLSISIPSGPNHRILFTRLSLYAIGKDVHIGSSVCPLKPVELICHGKPLRKPFRHRMQFICQIDVELSKCRMTMAPPTVKIPVLFWPLFLPVIPDRCMHHHHESPADRSLMTPLLRLRGSQRVVTAHTKNVKIAEQTANRIRIIGIAYIGTGLANTGRIFLVEPAVTIMVGMPAHNPHRRRADLAGLLFTGISSFRSISGFIRRAGGKGKYRSEERRVGNE